MINQVLIRRMLLNSPERKADRRELLALGLFTGWSVVPTVLRIGGYRFFFYANENNEPRHIHVQSAHTG